MTCLSCVDEKWNEINKAYDDHQWFLRGLYKKLDFYEALTMPRKYENLIKQKVADIMNQKCSKCDSKMLESGK